MFRQSCTAAIKRISSKTTKGVLLLLRLSGGSNYTTTWCAKVGLSDEFVLLIKKKFVGLFDLRFTAGLFF